MWILLEIILALLGRKFGRADEQEDLEDVKNSEEYMVMTPLQQWKARRRSKVLQSLCHSTKNYFIKRIIVNN